MGSNDSERVGETGDGSRLGSVGVMKGLKVMISNVRDLQWRGHGWVWVGSNPPTFKKGTHEIFANPKTFFGGWGSG